MNEMLRKLVTKTLIYNRVNFTRSTVERKYLVQIKQRRLNVCALYSAPKLNFYHDTAGRIQQPVRNSRLMLTR